MKLITRQEIKLGIQEGKRDFFDIGIDDLEADHYQDVITAFHHALGVVLPKVKIRKIYHVLFVVSNPCMIGRTGLGYLANTADVAVCIEDYIIINCKRMLEFKYEKIVAIFLEELVHAIMNVSDEELTHKIVCELYDKVQFLEGTYSVKEPN